MEKAHIIAEIQRTARENDGIALGVARFEEETGIVVPDWMVMISPSCSRETSFLADDVDAVCICDWGRK